MKACLKLAIAVWAVVSAIIPFWHTISDHASLFILDHHDTGDRTGKGDTHIDHHGISAYASSHMQNAYANEFATFTTRYRIFSDGVSLIGSWKDKGLKVSEIMSKFDSLKGPSLATLSFENGISKTWFNLSIGDGMYLDSSRLNLSINLKMSKFDRLNSSFKIDCSQWDEYFASGVLEENFYTTEPKSYFDMSFEMKILSILTGKPLDLDNYDLNDIRVDYSIKSNNLDIDIVGTMHNAIISTSSNWRGFLISLGFITLIFLSICYLFSIQESTTANLGFEAIALQMLFFYHCFYLLSQLIRVSKDHYFFMICLTVIAFFQSFTYQICAINYAANEMRYLNVRRNNRQRRETYALFWVIGSLMFFILMASTTRKIMVWKYHWVFMLGFFIYPIVQIIVTLVKANNSEVFDIRYQVMSWCIPLAYLYFMRGSGNTYANLKPHPMIMIYALSSIAFGTIFMLIQGIFGLYFFIPSSLLPNSKSLVVPASKVPRDNLNEDCSICCGTLKYDPMEDAELASQRGEGQDRDLESSADSQPLRTKVTQVMKLSCNHYFHEGCLKEWFKSRQVCPMCKLDVDYYDF